MKLYAPKYYQNFICIADQCKHSCCIGWEIEVDDNALRKYHALDSDYKAEIIESIDFSNMPHFRLKENGRCSHLDENGFCKLIKNAGEEYLCDICQEHPRFYNFTNHGKEVGLGMSCEEACRIILNSDYFDHIISIGEVPGEPDVLGFDATLERERVFKMLTDDEIGFEEKIGYMCDYYDLYLDTEQICPVLNSLEYLDKSHRDLFSKFQLERYDQKCEMKLTRALAYFVYRHCSEAEDFDEFSISLSFAILCTYLIASISNEENIDDMARIVSEEIEYSTDNIELLKFLDNIPTELIYDNN